MSAGSTTACPSMPGRSSALRILCTLRLQKDGSDAPKPKPHIQGKGHYVDKRRTSSLRKRHFSARERHSPEVFGALTTADK